MKNKVLLFSLRNLLLLVDVMFNTCLIVFVVFLNNLGGKSRMQKTMLLSMHDIAILPFHCLGYK